MPVMPMPDPSAKKLEANSPQLLPIDDLKLVAEDLKCIAHPYRLRILEIIISGEHSVDAIAKLCCLSQPATSGHLRLMESKGILNNERRGRTVYYAVINPQIRSVLQCVRQSLDRS